MTKATSPDKAPKIFEILTLTAGMTEDDLPEPVNGPYYVITKTKTFIHKFFHFGRVLTETTPLGLPHLATLTKPEWKGFLWHEVPPLPAGLVGQAWSFFQKIYKDLGTEAMVYITYHKEKGYRFFIPPQWNTGGHVNSVFNPEHIADGWQNVGTIHSHCNFSAFHSGTDHNDAKQQDGLHITIGNVNSDKPSYATMISVGGVNWDFKLTDVTTEEPALVPHPEWWERYVHKAEVKNQWKGYGATPSTTPSTPSDYKGWTQGSIWDNETRSWKQPGQSTFRPTPVPSLPATANGTSTPVTNADKHAATVAKFKVLAQGWQESSKMFKIGNDLYSGQNPVVLATLMAKYDALPQGWEKDEFEGVLKATWEEFQEQIEYFSDLGIKVGAYFEFDPELAAVAATWDDWAEKEATSIWGGSGDEIDDDEDDGIIRTVKPLHTLTDDEFKELYL